MLQCLRIEAKSSYYQSNSKLIGSNIYWKKTWQTVTINKDNCTFSAVCSLPKIFFKKIILIWRRWGTPQNFLLALIDELWKTWKIRILKNWKKIAQDIIILHMCTKNHNHMRYSSWYTEWDKQNFEQMKKASEDVIILNLCNKKHDQMMYAYSDTEFNRHFLLF